MKSFSNNPKYPLVIHPFGDVNAVWFKRSRSFLLMEEPAFFVLQEFLNGKDTVSIKKNCRKKFGSLEADTDVFVDEIMEYINQLNKVKTGNQVSGKNTAKNTHVPFNLNLKKFYVFGKTVIRIDYHDEWLQHLVHPSFKHLETGIESVPKYHVCCFRTDNLFVVTLNGKTVEAFDFQEEEYYKGAVSQLIYSIIYKKSFTGWMCTLHASGVYHNNKAIIFSAAAGSGKSTVAAILKANGTGYISDDFIAATPNGNVYPFPASISVKEGAVHILSSFYSEMNEKVLVKASTGKMVRYLPVNNFSESLLNGIPVTGFIFVSYQAESGFNLSEVGKKEALQLLLKEAWVNPKTSFIQAFFTWVEQTPFYRMAYSDNEKMISTIKKLLEYER
ncbi:MAG: hypothetical protein AB7S72_18655 [Draconibacterium sp.]